MSENWHYSSNGQQFGPVSTGELQDLAANGHLFPTDLVWREGMPNWVEANNFKFLFLKQTGNPSQRFSSGQPPISLPGVSPKKSGQGDTGLIVAGYICGTLALLFCPPGLGLAGFVIGILNLTKGHIIHGIAQIVISVTCGLFGMIIGAALAS